MNKKYRSECLKDPKTPQFPLTIISIETRFEPIVWSKPETQDAGFSAYSAQKPKPKGGTAWTQEVKEKLSDLFEEFQGDVIGAIGGWRSSDVSHSYWDRYSFEALDKWMNTLFRFWGLKLNSENITQTTFS